MKINIHNVSPCRSRGGRRHRGRQRCPPEVWCRSWGLEEQEEVEEEPTAEEEEEERNNPRREESVYRKSTASALTLTRAVECCSLAT